MLDLAKVLCPGHGPFHLLEASLASKGFVWDPHMLATDRPARASASNLKVTGQSQEQVQQRTRPARPCITEILTCEFKVPLSLV